MKVPFIRIALTVMLLCVSWSLYWTYDVYAPAYEAHMAIHQVNPDSDTDFVVARQISQGMIRQIIGAGLSVLLLAVWVPYIMKQGAEM